MHYLVLKWRNRSIFQTWTRGNSSNAAALAYNASATAYGRENLAGIPEPQVPMIKDPLVTERQLAKLRSSDKMISYIYMVIDDNWTHFCEFL